MSVNGSKVRNGYYWNKLVASGAVGNMGSAQYRATVTPELRALWKKSDLFARALASAPNIHVSSDGETTILKRGECDARYADRAYGNGYICGGGSKEYPFKYRSAAPVSPHYGIVDLWSKFSSVAGQASAKPIFIEVNNWVLQVTPEGVLAEDGHLTRLAVK